MLHLISHKMYRLSDLLVLSVFLSSAYVRGKGMTDIETLAAKPTHCTYEYAYDMYGAYCAGLRLSKVPSLRGGIEILDFSDNKLQEIHADTLSSFTNVKFMYLAENQIYLIDEDALTSFTSLLTLDLSNNVILKLPNSILQLPSLRKLYLKGNPLLHLSLNDLMISRPIKAPLELLDISDCKIKELPYWGHLPQLLFYNISHNPLTKLDTNHFAAMCSLGKVDLTESIANIKLCNMRAAISWFQEKKIFFQLQDYSKLNTAEFENCPKVNNTLLYNATYHKCKADYLEVQNIKVTRRKWLTIGGGLAGFLVGFILLLYIMHRHNVAQTKSASEKLKQKTRARDGDKQTTAILLNEEQHRT